MYSFSSYIIQFHISGMGGLCLILSRTSESPPDFQKSQFKLSVMCILSVSIQTLSCTFAKDMAGYIKQDVRHPVLLPLQYTAVPHYVLTAMQHQHNCLLIVNAREAPSRNVGSIHSHRLQRVMVCTRLWSPWLISFVL